VELVPELPEEQKPGERELVVWCRERLAGYKVPKTIRIVEALPRNATGKIVRRELKALL
jgi:acyl-coenzyme A synthetase/AMP-(fatty) acid ligase